MKKIMSLHAVKSLVKHFKHSPTVRGPEGFKTGNCVDCTFSVQLKNAQNRSRCKTKISQIIFYFCLFANKLPLNKIIIFVRIFLVLPPHFRHPNRYRQSAESVNKILKTIVCDFQNGRQYTETAIFFPRSRLKQCVIWRQVPPPSVGWRLDFGAYSNGYTSELILWQGSNGEGGAETAPKRLPGTLRGPNVPRT